MRAEIELYAHRTSPLHDWDARWKVVSLAWAIAVLAALDRWPTAALGVAGALALLLWGRLPVQLLVARLGAAQVFLLPCLLLLPFTFTAEPLSIGPLQVSGEGLRVAGLLYLRALAILAVAMALVYSTPMLALLRGLQRLRVPRTLTEITLLAYRYLFTVSGEFTRIRWALATRGFGTRPPGRTYATLAGVVGTSLVRSLERTERVQQALRCRGFTGELHTLHTFDATTACWLKAGVCIAAGAALLVLDRAFWRGSP